MNPTAIVVMDLETTGLHPIHDEIWEVAAIRRDPDETETEYHAFVRHDQTRAAGLPEEFRADHDTRYRADLAVTPARVVDDLKFFFYWPGEYRTRPHVVGAVPSFDTERLGNLFRGYGVEVPWHHHLIDVETLAAGWLRGQRQYYLSAGIHPEDAPAFPPPPWDSEDLSRAVGVDPDQFERHTAMGDVRWAMAIYDVVMGCDR